MYFTYLIIRSKKLINLLKNKNEQTIRYYLNNYFYKNIIFYKQFTFIIMVNLKV